MTIRKIVKSASFVFGVAGLWSMAAASTVNVDLGEEHQVIRGFGGMVHNQWQGGSGLSEADAKPIIEGTDCEYKDVDTLRVSRYYDGHYNFEFPNFSEKTTISYSKLKDIIECSINELKKSINDKNESKDSQVSSLEEYLIKDLATLSHTERVGKLQVEFEHS